GPGLSCRPLALAPGPASAAGTGGGHLPAAGAGRLVPARRGAARMSTVLALPDIIGGRVAGADGYVRLAVDAGTWAALAEGCAAGQHDLGALWADDGVMRLGARGGARAR